MVPINDNGSHEPQFFQTTTMARSWKRDHPTTEQMTLQGHPNRNQVLVEDLLRSLSRLQDDIQVELFDRRRFSMSLANLPQMLTAANDDKPLQNY